MIFQTKIFVFNNILSQSVPSFVHDDTTINYISFPSPSTSCSYIYDLFIGNIISHHTSRISLSFLLLDKIVFLRGNDRTIDRLVFVLLYLNLVRQWEHETRAEVLLQDFTG
jgi:hypothetical protein